MKGPGVVGLVLLLAAGGITPAAANWFSDPYLGINRNIGSAPNPTPEQIRQEGFGVHSLVSNTGDLNKDYIPKPIPPSPYFQAYATPWWYHQTYASNWSYWPSYSPAPYTG